MPVTSLPDLPGGINARVRSLAAVTSLAGTNVSTTRQAAWNLPNRAILIEAGQGGGEDDSGLLWERIGLRCYGAGKDQGTQARDAHLLWRTLHFWICPPVGSGRAAGFTVIASGAPVTVTKVELEGGPLRLVEPDDAWPYTLGTYRFYYSVPEAA